MNLVKLLRRLKTENTLKVTKTLFFVHKGICLYILIRSLYDDEPKIINIGNYCFEMIERWFENSVLFSIILFHKIWIT